MIVSKHIIFKPLLFLSVLVLLINSYELTFLVWSVTAFVSLHNKYSISIIILITVFVFVILVAFLSSFFNTHTIYNFIRDFAYLMKPILGLLIGYNICKHLGTKTIYYIIYIGIVLALYHIVLLTFCYLILSIRDMHALRSLGGYFNDFEIYVLILLLFYKELGLQLNPKKVKLFLIIMSVSSFLYLARTNIIQLIILFLAMKGYFKITRTGLKKILISLSIVILAYAAIYNSNPRRSGKGLEAFLYKIKIAPIESFKTKIDQNDWKDFNDNYRSFENIITVKQVTSNGWSTILFGEGLGSRIDLGRELWTNDGEEIRYIPTLHNAYMTTFLKSGLLGVLSCFVIIYFFIKQNKTKQESLKYINYLLIGSGVYLIMSNWVFMGFYLKLDNKSVFLGFLLAYKELLANDFKPKELNDNEK